MFSLGQTFNKPNKKEENWVQNTFEKKKWAMKNYGPQTNFGSKNFFGPNKLLVKKNCLRRILVKRIFGKKYYG